MAIRIPTLDAPRVSSTPSPTPFERTDSSPNEQGEALVSEALGAVGKIGFKLKQEADEQAVLEAHNAFRRFTDEGLERVKRAEGKNAAIEANKFYEEADKESKRLFGSLQNVEQRKAFTKYADDELIQTKRIGESHVGQQIAVAREEEFNGANALSLKRATDNAAVPGIAETEAAAVEERVRSYAAQRGLPPEAAEALRNQKVGVIYGAQARTLLGLGDFQGAQAVINAHAKELGEDAHELRGKVEIMARHARADEAAQKYAQDFKFPDGTVDTTKALAEIDKKYAAGPEREAVKEFLLHRASQAANGRKAFEAATWDGLLNDYQNMGRSLASAKKSKYWGDATPDQRDRLRDRYLADQKSGDLTRDQQRALGRLENDIMDRQEFWGTAENSVLDQNKDFNLLPERYRIQLIEKVAATHRDRQNPQQQLANADRALRSRAVANGILSSSIVGKPFDKWEEEDQEKWFDLQDRAAPLIASWYDDPKNRGKRLSNAAAEQFVDDITQTGYIKNGHWFWINKGGVKAEDAAKRPLEDQAAHPFVPDLKDDVREIGEEVQRRRGMTPDDNPNAFTNEALIEATRAYKMAKSGPGPQERVEIVKALKAAGAKNPNDPFLIQQMYEGRVLDYVPKPPARKAKPAQPPEPSFEVIL